MKLPEKLKAPCCLGSNGKPKGCGYAELYLDGTYHNGRLCYVYKRISNDECYTKPMSKVETARFANIHKS